ncbi:MAG: hypothetical protein JXQ73_23895 [Phycisphaerae bacterium]|nr:hypothetical protein [Phycisphaerae bacterium]
MAIRYQCDRCGKRLEPDDPNRFVVKIEVFAAADHITITQEDLKRDHRREIARLLEQLDKMDPDEIEDQTYRSLRFDLCRECHRAYLRDPIGSE